MAADLFAITKEGISQSERWFNTLVPAYVKIDSRRIPDLIWFIHDLSRKITYYNEQNEREGNWEDFFLSDANILAVLVSRFDINGTGIEYGKRKAALQQAADAGKAVQRLEDLLEFLALFTNQVQTLKKRFLEAENYQDVAQLAALLDQNEADRRLLLTYFNEARSKFKLQHAEQLAAQFPETDTPLEGEEEIFRPGATDKESILEAIDDFNRLFDRMFTWLVSVVKAFTEYVSTETFSKKTYQPQMGLFIAFLELYSHLKLRMNGLVRKHLDFYYKDVLAMTRREPRADTVHLVIEPDAQANPFTLLPDDLLMAEIAGGGAPVLYSPDGRQVIGQASIAEIKTLFVSDYTQIIAKDRLLSNVREAEVYKAEYAPVKPAAFMKSAGVNPWAIMGEDQHEQAESERTMSNCEVGLVLASTLFYQKDGARSFRISIDLEPATSAGLNEYIDNFSGVSNKSREIILHEMFSNALLLRFTGPEGWETVKKYSVEVKNPQSRVNTLEISFTLDTPDKAFDVYKEEVHQMNLPTSLPLLQIILNNFVEHYPYGFLRNLMLDRVTIQVKVKGFKEVKLQNNVGPLSIAAPFQPFGPQPALGSYLDIKNTNVFNHYLKNFSIRLEWLELPQAKGGFENYYAGYGLNYNNDSFEVEISSLQGSSYKPERGLRQRFKLFSATPDTEELRSVTELKGMDFKKLEFRAEPQLAGESLISEHFFRDGAVRLELCSPQDAFGHRIFPLIFPDIILNNAKKFKKKIPVPNQPYIPIVKSVEIDFESEFSESFKDETSADTSFQVFHLHPFGHEEIYPKGEQKNYRLLPQFADSGNLMIGIENATGAAEISLLFQMEEKGFHHTLHEPEPVKWSYLEGDSWVELPGDNILSDNTGDFINSGLVKLRLPARISKQHTTLTSGLFWLRASVKGPNNLHGRVTGIFMNGISATRVIQPQEESLRRLEPGTIRSFAKNTKGVQQVWQLFPSFGGIASETADKYYVRVSERLRHKARPVQAEDIMQLILEQFPNVMIAKCYSSENEKEIVVPDANVQVILIPKETDGGAFKSEEPRVSLADLYRVKTFIEGLMPPFNKVEVGNAVYEKVKVFCKVLFERNSGMDNAALTRRFIADVNSYIAPWKYGKDPDIKIGSRIYRSELSMFLKNLPYVRYITGFSLVHFLLEKDVEENEFIMHAKDSAAGSFDYIEGSTPASVLIPSAYHSISLIDEANYEDPAKAGIGDFVIGSEFHVNAGRQVEERPQQAANEEETFEIVITHNID